MKQGRLSTPASIQVDVYLFIQAVYVTEVVIKCQPTNLPCFIPLYFVLVFIIKTCFGFD